MAEDYKYPDFYELPEDLVDRLAGFLAQDDYCLVSVGSVKALLKDVYSKTNMSVSKMRDICDEEIRGHDWFMNKMGDPDAFPKIKHSTYERSDFLYAVSVLIKVAEAVCKEQ